MGLSLGYAWICDIVMLTEDIEPGSCILNKIARVCV